MLRLVICTLLSLIIQVSLLTEKVGHMCRQCQQDKLLRLCRLVVLTGIKYCAVGAFALQCHIRSRSIHKLINGEIIAFEI
jgi:hypothetical protein